MGLTLHYRLTAPAGLSARGAAALVRRLHAIAGKFSAGGRVADVLPVSSDRPDLERWANAWRVLPHPDQPATNFGVQIPPAAGWIFPVDLGDDCELLWLGLCRYPARIVHDGRSLATRLGPRWQFARFCKTQYASLHGWDHFARCHTAAVDLLRAACPLGLRVKLTDEGGYWPHRRLPVLRERIDRMNGVVAALAGALKDAADATGGSTVQSPIFAHPHFERIEAEGAAANAEHLRATVTTVLGAGVAPPRAE
jgi:hypothetical protein